jgi:hypothetical protein
VYHISAKNGNLYCNRLRRVVATDDVWMPLHAHFHPEQYIDLKAPSGILEKHKVCPDCEAAIDPLDHLACVDL